MFFLRSALRRTSPSRPRRWVEVREDEGGRAVDLTIVRPASPLASRGRTHVQFAPQTTCHPRSRPTSTWPKTVPLPQQVRGDVIGSTRYEHGSSGYNDEDARHALLAIYQAGKPDMMFQTRAPSSAALEKMLSAMSDARGRDGHLRKHDYPQHRDAETRHGYTTGRDVSDDDQPVKVKVECPPRGDTVFSFRVQSRAA